MILIYLYKYVDKSALFFGLLVKVLLYDKINRDTFVNYFKKSTEFLFIEKPIRLNTVYV